MSKEVISATIATTQDALQKALVLEHPVIIIKGSLFDKALPQIKKSKQAKTNKKIGGVAMVAGFLAGGPLGWTALGIGGLNAVIGKKRDPDLLKQYRIEIKESDRKIFLYKVRGWNKYDSSKMTFRE